MSDLILYETEDGRTRLQLKLEGGTAWLTQQQMAELFETSKQNVSLHIKNVFEEGELLPEAVVKDSLTTAADGKRYQTNFYNLDVVLAIGYRVRSPRGTQFRRWATTTLREYVVKGFAMDDERLKDPAGLDYFDELLERVRDIRASEQRFYGKIRDLFALSSDYRKDDADAHVFFAEVQNKLLHAVTGSTAAELVLERSNADQPNMGLQSWKGTKVRKGDVTTGKNYLTAEEIGKLNRLVTIFLDQAALRVQGGDDLTLGFWRKNVDRFIAFSDLPVLENLGSVSAEKAKRVAETRYEAFDRRRRAAEAAASPDELAELKRIASELKKRRGKS